MGQLVRRGEPPARRPVRHLRAGPATRSPTTRCSIPDGPNSCSMGTMLGRRAYTTIDRSKPTRGDRAGRRRRVLTDAKVALKVDFSDDVAGPFPANFLCFQYGGGPSGLCDTTPRASSTATTRPARSPASGGKSTSFTCTADYGSGEPAPTAPCGRACAPPTRRSRTTRPARTRAPRRTRPTSPTRPATASCSTAPRRPPRSRPPRPRSRSATSCPSRRRPRTRPPASAAQSAWTWGDNTRRRQRRRGDPHVHAGRHLRGQARPSTDNAGNAGTATKVITVSARRRRHHDAGRRTTTPGRHDDAGRRHDRRRAARRRRRRHDAPGGGTTTPGGDGDAAPRLDARAPRARCAAKAKADPASR